MTKPEGSGLWDIFSFNSIQNYLVDIDCTRGGDPCCGLNPKCPSQARVLNTQFPVCGKEAKLLKGDH